MILQYGLKNSNAVTYIESDIIESSIISLVDILDDDEENRRNNDDLEKKIFDFIKDRIHSGGDIFYVIGSKDISKLSIVNSVTLRVENDLTTYIFDAFEDSEYAIYLLNNNGKTISRL